MQGMGDFIGEMAQMMSQVRPTVRADGTTGPSYRCFFVVSSRPRLAGAAIFRFGCHTHAALA